MELLNKCVTENLQAQELEMPVIRKFFAKAEKEKPFSNVSAFTSKITEMFTIWFQDEIDACIEKMSDENKVMRSEDTIYII